MNILIGCECSGIVREAFRKRGHNAWSCDLLAAEDGSPYHLQCDIRDVLHERWDMGIFFPDCTYLTISAEWAYADMPMINERPRNIKPGTLIGAARREAREQAVGFVKKLWNTPYPKAIENPVGALSRLFMPPSQYIQPYQFGANASKNTCLWLNRLDPLPIDPEKYVKPRAVCPDCGSVMIPCMAHNMFEHGCQICGCEAGRIRPRWGNQTDGGQNSLPPGENRWMDRARTYPGIAEAMAAHWGDIDGTGNN